MQLTEANLIMKAGEGEEEIGGERNGSVGGRKTEKKLKEEKKFRRNDYLRTNG